MVALKRRVQGTHIQSGLFVVAAQHNAARAHEVINGRAFLQKLRIGDHGERRSDPALVQLCRNGRSHRVCRAHGHCALVHHHLVVIHVAADITRGAQHILQVGGAILTRRRTYRNELNGAKVGGAFNICGEVQASCLDIATHHVLQPRLVDRNLTTQQLFNFAGVGVKANHIVTYFGQTGSCNQAHIAGSDDSDFHGAAISNIKNTGVCAGGASH